MFFPRRAWGEIRIKAQDELYCRRAVARDNTVIIATKGTGWASDRVSLGGHLNAHAHKYCGKRMPLKHGHLFGGAREDGGDQLERENTAYSKLCARRRPRPSVGRK